MLVFIVTFVQKSFFFFVAAHFLHRIESEYGAIKDKHVVDLGCGCGVLSIAAVMLGCGLV